MIEFRTDFQTDLKTIVIRLVQYIRLVRSNKSQRENDRFSMRRWSVNIITYTVFQKTVEMIEFGFK